MKEPEVDTRDHDGDLAATYAMRLASLAGRTALAVQWMGGVTPAMMIRAEDALTAAGLLALPLAVETLRRADLGQFRLDERLPASDDAPGAEGEASVGGLLALALGGDDSAANRLLDLVGRGEVNETATRMGLRQTRLATRFGEIAAHRENTTTASDMVTLLALVRGNALPGAKSLRAVLAETRRVDDLVVELPDGVEAARIASVTRDSFGEAGILTGQGMACVYCFLAAEQADPQTARTAFATILRDLWNRPVGGE
jgi:beta-lactamase class A